MNSIPVITDCDSLREMIVNDSKQTIELNSHPKFFHGYGATSYIIQQVA